MKARRAGWLLVVATFAFGIVSAVKPAPTEAYGLLSSRSIRMSSSVSNATNTIYRVGFTTVTAGQTVGSVVIKFCANNPIIGDTCTAPTGLDVNKATLSLNGLTGNITGLTVNTANVQPNILLLTRTAGAVANGAVSFELGNGSTNGITNPTIAGNSTSFYARIFLFPSSTPDLTTPSYESTATTGNDAGGTALAIVNALNVTAKVQETLKFCVFTLANCAAGGSAVALGDSNGVLSDTTVTYTSNAKFEVASNALAGVIVRLKGDTLRSGAFSISPSGNTCAADPVTTTTELFGVRVVTYGTGQNFGGAALGDADDFGCLAGNHKFDPATTNTTYGQNFVKTIGATDLSETTFELAAKAAGTTEAGIYTTTLQLIATATY